jgi:tRNA pseudouridine38-40 synthase
MSGYRAGEDASDARRIKVIVEYDGTRYAGFQEQPNQPTIQGEMERALAEVTQQKTKIVGAGRTDAGVHARGQVAHFLTGRRRSLKQLHRAFNALLPHDIAIREMTLAELGFHARFSAVSREYRYTILNQAVRSPLEERYTYHSAQPLDVAAMEKALTCLIGTHDFASFGQPTQGDNTVREVMHASCREEGTHVYIDLTANAFLRRMVRSIVGTLLLVGKGKLSPLDAERVLQAKDRSLAGAPAPAHGLCLVRVNY